MTGTAVRTVLGDIAARDLGVTYAHEHLVIDGNVAKIINPEISLQSVEDAVAELVPCQADGVTAVIDAMPADCGRNVLKLAEISRRSGVHVVVATGLHHARYYGERHWSELLDIEGLARLFEADITEGVDELDYCGPVVRRTPHRAGIIKVAGSDGGPSPRDRRTFEAAALASQWTGAPVITHCEGGTGAVEQVALFASLGVPAERVMVSHTDKVTDLGYHRELLGMGVRVVYDQGIRTPEATAALVVAAVEGGWAEQVLLGTDGARRSLWAVLGGSPGLAALRTSLGARLLQTLGEGPMRRIWVDNPAHFLTLARPSGRPAW